MTAAVDGRVLRGARNREAIADALLRCYEEGILRPSATQVAERAGVSARSVHNHFADMETLRAEAARRQWSRYTDVVTVPDPSLDLEARVAHVVDGRGGLWDAVTPVRRAALLAVHSSPTITANFARIDRRLRRVIELAFTDELANGDDDDVLDAIDALLSFDGWNRLRTAQGCSPPRARRILTRSILMMLEAGSR
ncbi:MAG: TetR/AcrR family transcriptional regulator [Actinomycetota bacterium]